MNKEQFCVAYVFSAFFSKRSCFPPFLFIPLKFNMEPEKKSLGKGDSELGNPSFSGEPCSISGVYLFVVSNVSYPFGLGLRAVRCRKAILFSARLRLPASHLSMLEEPTDYVDIHKPWGWDNPSQ